VDAGHGDDAAELEDGEVAGGGNEPFRWIRRRCSDFRVREIEPSLGLQERLDDRNSWPAKEKHGILKRTKSA
jgi:hypothetical protein